MVAVYGVHRLTLCFLPGMISLIIMCIGIIRPHRSTTYVDAACCYQQVASSVGWSVTLVSPTKTAEPIEMQFGLRTRVGPGNHKLDGVQIPLREEPILGERGARCKV